MTDRELLELAAKAAGLKKDDSDFTGGGRGNDGFCFGDLVLDWHTGKTWNPLTDDGDALRLAVKLGMRVSVYSGQVVAEVLPPSNNESIEYGHDLCAATRRAIVRAAAEIGQR